MPPPPPSVQPSPTILLPPLPPKTFVGIDLITFTSTPNFHGIRDLPEGWHFLYTGTTESFSLRSGAWFYVGDISCAGSGSNFFNDNDAGTALVPTTSRQNEPQIYIWRWNTDTEALDSLSITDPDRQEAMRYKANLGAVWQRGGLFRYRSRVSASMLSNQGQSGESSTAQAEKEEDDDKEEETEESGRRDWQGLTDRITPDILSRIVGNPQIDVDGHPRWTVTSASTANRDADHIPGVDAPNEGAGAEGTERDAAAGELQEREFGFLPIDLKRTWREGAVGRERTEAAQDRSWALGELVERYNTGSGGTQQTGETQLLGELQFTFLMVLTMMNHSCLQQWKRLLELILTSRRAILEREGLMSAVLRLLLLQLQRCDDVEGGLFEMDGDEGGAFLRNLLMKLQRGVDEVVVGSGGVAGSMVKAELGKLEAWVKAEYDWELQREAIVRRGMIQLEDGEEVEMEMDGNDEDEETGEYAPLVVDLDGGSGGGELPEDGSIRDTEVGE
ncbi:hypothetical protein N7474_010905 [Penicillium riverlandense]|uniref:uncharacterized protein n=1 Tax=Penicillium riverlandense TaxID=1903569 RepID=UPI002546A132|nr:uncharacterized protein N7474_010905 [Penicillium riverlandense]KAJ5805018.1 hypothetical protein N7474_010905 [Penicillium riverlandense]